MRILKKPIVHRQTSGGNIERQINLEVPILPSFKTLYRRNRLESSSIVLWNSFYEWRSERSVSMNHIHQPVMARLTACYLKSYPTIDRQTKGQPIWSPSITRTPEFIVDGRGARPCVWFKQKSSRTILKPLWNT